MKYNYSTFFKRLLCIILLSGSMIACSDETDISPGNRGDLIASSQSGTLTKEDIIERITELSAKDFAKFGVTFYSVTYRTDYMGQPIDSRGLLIVPNGMTQLKLLMYCHGTEIPSKILGSDKITPSLYDGDKETHKDVRNMGLGWATAGYAVFMPDYIGFGATLGKDHPYVYFPEMFKSNIDGLLAVKRWIKEKGLSYDNRLFLAGWSQGAGASLSAHKYIQESYANEFSVAASSGLAGPYNFTRFSTDILDRRAQKIDALPVFSWGIYSLNKFSGIKRNTDQIFSYPVFDQMSSILGPSNKPDDIFNHFFLDKWQDGSDKVLISEIKKNSFHENWRPVGKVFLHHGDNDNLVPYFNSQDAYAGLTAAGGDVKLYTYPNGKHDTELGNFIRNTLHDFDRIP